MAKPPRKIPSRNPVFKSGPVRLRADQYLDRDGHETLSAQEVKKLSSEIEDLTPESIRAIVQAKVGAERDLQEMKARHHQMQEALDAATNELTILRKRLRRTPIKAIKILTVDDIDRDGKAAILACTADLDGDIQEIPITIPVQQIVRLIKQQKAESK